MNWVDSVVRQGKERPEHAAFIAADRVTTYIALCRHITALAEALRKLAVGENSRVLCRVQQSEAYYAVYGAVIALGAVFVPIEETAPQTVLDKVLASVGDCALIVGESDDVRPGIPCLGYAQILTLCSTDATLLSVTSQSGGQILFTTGSSGKAKGVCSGNEIFAPCVQGWAANLFSAQDVRYIFGQPNHFGVLFITFATLAAGGTVVISQGVTNLEDLFHATEAYAVNAVFATASAYRILHTLCRESFAGFAQTIKDIKTGGEKCGAAMQQALLEWFPYARCSIFYGSTEGGLISVRAFDADSVSENCVGRLLDGISAVTFDANEQVLPQGKIGTLQINTPYGMKGYLGSTRCTDTRSAISVGDTGYLKDTELYLLGRSDGTIISGGLNVRPEEVEEAAASMPGIAACVCVGKSHRVLGNTVCLYVVWQAERPFDEFAIKKYLSTKLEPYKLPRCIRQIEALHKTASGKIDRVYYKEMPL